MRIVVALVSSFKSSELETLTKEFVKRASKFASVDFITFKKDTPLQEIKQKHKGYKLIALAEKGKEYNSQSFAERLEKIVTYENSNLLFVVSDADGFKKEELSSADEISSLSKLTFPHEIATMVLVEQIYRALSILNNHPYHRK